MIQFGVVKYGILKRFKDHQNGLADDGSSGNEDTPQSPNYQNTHFTCAFCEEIFENRFNLGLHFKMCPNKPIIETSDEDDDCNNFTGSEISDNKELVNVILKKTHDEGADKNNNNDEIEETFADQEMDEDEDEESEDIPLDLSSTMAPVPPPSHVTLEALQNTKVAVAQFAATALANNYNNEDTIKELAALQSTLFNIQHQQLFQIQLIHQLQSQLSVNHESDEKKEEIEEVEAEEKLSEEKKEEKEDLEVLPKTPEAKTYPQATVPLLEDKIELSEPQEILKTEEKIDEPKTRSEKKIPEDTLEKPTSEEKLKSVKDPQDIPLQTPYCQISSSLASSIITHHDPSPPPNGPNSLEMLQRRAQEVLDSASQGILAGNMADELAFRRDRASQDGKGRGEPFFKHRCRYCGKVFGSDSALQIHIRSHTGERPFQCNVCGSRFTTKGNLKVHYQRHTQRFPNIPMGQAPLPEHYDTYHAPLLPHHPSIRPPPNYPSNGNGLPFPHILPGSHLPMMRPPEDFVRSPPDVPLEKVQNDRQEFHESQDEPADLRVTTFRIASPPPKTPIESENIVENKNVDQKNKETCERSKQVQYISPANVNHTNSYEDQSIDSSRESDQEQPENLSKQSVRSSISRNSSISESAKEMETFANHPHYENHDNSWENLIEITKTSETSKLQQLVDNIENKLSDPNQCIFCQRILSCRSALQMHYRTHTGERPFRCRICSRAFATKGNLKAHMSIHKIKPPIRSQFRCPVCHNKYSNAIVLQEHIRTHSGEDMNMTSEQINAMEVRDEMSSPARSGSTNNNLDLSLSGFSGIASESSQCDYDEFLDGNDEENDSDDDMFSEHTATALSEPKESTENINCNKSDKNEARNISKKPESHRMFGTNFEQSKSVKSLSESSESSCSALDLTPKSNPNSEQKIVEKKGSSLNSSYQHLPPTSVSLPGTMVPTSLIALAQSVPTSTPLTIGGSRNTATCNICYKTFACNSALEMHFRSHTKERPYRCNFCDRAFSTKIEEIMHSTAHNSSAKGNLKQHLLTHKSREVNRSVEDLSSNSNQTSLESSFRAQSPSPKKSDRLDPDQIMPKVVSATTPSVDQNKVGIKRPFSDVDQPFFRLHLPPHMPVTNSPSSAINQNVPVHCTTPTTNINYPIQHSPVRPESANSESPINTKHLCTVCRKNFSSSSALQIHMRTHTGDKPFRCSVCQKAFTTKGNLKVHMGTHMWTNGASRRGRRMSLELPLNRPLPLSPQDTEFLQRRPDIFYPYIPPFLNGIQQKFGDLSSIPPPPYTGLANGSMSPHALSNKYAGMLGFGPYLPGHSPNMPNFSLHGSPSSPNSFNRKMQLGPPLNQNFEKFGEQKFEYSTQHTERMEKVWDLQYEGKLLKNLSEPHKSDEDREIPLQSNRKEELAT